MDYELVPGLDRIIGEVLNEEFHVKEYEIDKYES